MKVLIKGAKIIDKNSSFNGKVVDVSIDKGKIVDIGKNLPTKGYKLIDGKGKLLTIGWVDMNCTIGDPGFEHKEDFETAAETAIAGGFTSVVVLPNNQPVTQSKNDVKYILSNNTQGVDFYPIAAVTINTEGNELTEMIDLNHAGAVAFSDGNKPIWHSDILLKTLQYLQKFDGVLINRAEDLDLNRFGVMNEGISSTMLGMKGMPKLSEEVALQRDLNILAYTNGRLHVSNVSSDQSLALIKTAKKQGLNVTCDIAAFQTAFTDEDLHDFDTSLKVNPPFRSKKDNAAIYKALENGTIDVIVSSHTPHDEESKNLEFDLADFGISSLQTVASDICRMSDKVAIEILLEKVTTRPNEILKLKIEPVEKDSAANLTLLDPDKIWQLNEKTNKSKARNSPYWRKELKGQVVAVIKGNKLYQV